MKKLVTRAYQHNYENFELNSIGRNMDINLSSQHGTEN
jgi:hypothetical protein